MVDGRRRDGSGPGRRLMQTSSALTTGRQVAGASPVTQGSSKGFETAWMRRLRLRSRPADQGLV
jgi:hypothetical protein